MPYSGSGSGDGRVRRPFTICCNTAHASGSKSLWRSVIVWSAATGIGEGSSPRMMRSNDDARQPNATHKFRRIRVSNVTFAGLGLRIWLATDRETPWSSKSRISMPVSAMRSFTASARRCHSSSVASVVGRGTAVIVPEIFSNT